MKLVATIVTLAATLAIAPCAQAQDAGRSLGSRQETGTAMRRSAQPVDDQALVNRYSKAVAACVTNRIGGNVRTLLQHSDPQQVDFEGSGVNRGRFMRSFERCMGQRLSEFSNNPLLSNLGMSFAPARLRALLIEEGYLEDNSAPPVIATSAAERVDRPFVSSGDTLLVAQGLGLFSDCIVYHDAEGADALVRTEPGSSEEMEAAQALAPTLGACLIEGQEMQLTAASVRAMAADGLWTRATYGAVGSAE